MTRTPGVRMAALRAIAVAGEAEHAWAIVSALTEANGTSRPQQKQCGMRLEERLERSFEDLCQLKLSVM